MTTSDQGVDLRALVPDLDQRIDAVVARVKAMFEPFIEAAVAEILGAPDDTVVTITVERGDETTTTVYSSRQPTSGNADFGTFLAERGIAEPKVTADV